MQVNFDKSLVPKDKRLHVKEDHPFFNTQGMYYKEFPSIYNQIRAFALFIIQKAPHHFREINLLEQQLSEVLKNAIKHGNKCEPSKKIKVWYEFEGKVRVIVEDEGDGFNDIDKWNSFYDKRNECFETQDFENMMKYVAWKTEKSDETDGGNSLFAAVEYWNGGMIYNEKKNKVVIVRFYPEYPDLA
jgi:anti-sigma regulatory factor (Ser/Thr protein kinase)